MDRRASQRHSLKRCSCDHQSEEMERWIAEHLKEEAKPQVSGAVIPASTRLARTPQRPPLREQGPEKSRDALQARSSPTGPCVRRPGPFWPA